MSAAISSTYHPLLPNLDALQLRLECADRIPLEIRIFDVIPNWRRDKLCITGQSNEQQVSWLLRDGSYAFRADEDFLQSLVEDIRFSKAVVEVSKESQRLGDEGRPTFGL